MKQEKNITRFEVADASNPTSIHLSAIIGEQIELRIETVVMARGVINWCTKASKGCIINTGVTIDYDNAIEDYVHISPGQTWLEQ